MIFTDTFLIGPFMLNLWNKKKEHNFFCTVPASVLNIYEKGEVSFCCTSWQPHYIGNINSQTFLEMMESSKAVKIQDSVNYGDFSYCKKDVCPSLVSFKANKTLSGSLTENPISPWTLTKNLTLFLNYDKSCNLRCPSCRNDFIYFRKDQLPISLQETHNAVLTNIFELLRSGYKLELNITGSGDPFASAVYSELLEDICHEPNVTFTLQTNGVLMTQERFHSRLKEKTRHVNISVDAATESTYEKVRPGGKWKQLKKNILQLDQNISDKQLPPNFSWQLNFIVQQENYLEIPLFLDWTFQLKSKPNIWFNLIDDWGHLGNTQFNNKAIWKNAHPNHQDFLQTVSKIPKNNPQIIQSNLMQFL